MADKFRFPELYTRRCPFCTSRGAFHYAYCPSVPLSIAADPTTGGKKGQKPERIDLIPAEFLLEVGRVYHYGGFVAPQNDGTKGYGAHNWRKGYPWSWALSALFRHIFAWVLGEARDKESNLHHLAHACFHLATLFTFELHKKGTDDRSLEKEPKKC